MQDLLDAVPDGPPLVVVGFSAPADMAALAAHLGLHGPVVADPDRALYRLIDLPRAPVWQVYSPSTLARYALAALRGTRRTRPGPTAMRPGPTAMRPGPTAGGSGAVAEDTRQLGGDALVVDGVVVRRWRPRTPADRVDPPVLLGAVRPA